MIAAKSKWLHGLALHGTTITMGLSVVVCLAYWPFEYENFYRDYRKQHLKENYEYLNAGLVHSFPLISSVFNIMFFKVVLLKRDAKLPFLLILAYIPVNYYAKYFTGNAVYWQSDLVDWS